LMLSKYERVLDFVHRHKRALGLVVVFLAGGFRALGFDGVEHFLLYLGATAGLGVLPEGPNPKR
jgi:hypothetical protein